jgi:hypothetical protein
VGSIPANSDAQNVPSFRRWRFEMKLSPFFFPWPDQDLQSTCLYYDLIMKWQRLTEIRLSVMEAEHQNDPQPPDAFEALEQGELIMPSIMIAQAIALKHIRRPGETRRSFGFEGHRALNRELNLLRTTISIVFKSVNHDSELLQCPHRLTRWINASTSTFTEVVFWSH